MTNRTIIYASYGIIMKELQNTELLMTQAIYTINLKKGKIRNAEKAKQIYSNRLKNTFGQLVKIFEDLNPKSEFKLQQQYFDELEKIKQLRNLYAHSFFKEFPYFESDGLIQEIIESNKFAFEAIKKSNLLLKKALCDYLKDMKYSNLNIEEMTHYFSENWADIEI